MTDRSQFLPAFIIALGLIGAGFFIGEGFLKSRTYDRYVTVKGLAEKEVDADLAIWPIQFSVSTNDLSSVETELREKSEVIQNFLVASGFPKEEITVGVPSITDLEAREYYSGQRQPYRYLAKGRISVNTAKVSLLRETMSRITELIGKGIVVSGESYDSRVQFIFTKLNEIKPQMIEEATLNARKAAEKFASDSKAELGKIRRADQGLFTIVDRDMNSPHKKKVRIVSTIQFLLE